MNRYTVFETSWGLFAFVTGPRGLRASFLPGASERALSTRIRRDWPDAAPDPSALPELQRAIRAYFDGADEVDPARLDLELDLSAQTAFRRAVLRACRTIPRGRTLSYAGLARRAGSPGATRAAGSTMANNPLGLLVPCHRVLRADGALGGFSAPGGASLKRRLLEHEGAFADELLSHRLERIAVG